MALEAIHLSFVLTADHCMSVIHFVPATEDDHNGMEMSNIKKRDVAYSLNYTLQLISRQQWSKFKTELEDCDDLKIRPAKFVVMSHTVSSTCDKPLICEDLMITMQSDHIRKGFCDIGYNFVVADDGYIYEGRGWGIFGAHTYGYNCDSIGVGLMGNFNINHPSELLLQSLHLLIEEGLRINEISRDYKLIFQSQVNGKASPGLNVEQVLKKWSHWSIITKDDELCKNN